MRGLFTETRMFHQGRSFLHRFFVEAQVCEGVSDMSALIPFLLLLEPDRCDFPPLRVFCNEGIQTGAAEWFFAFRGTFLKAERAVKAPRSVDVALVGVFPFERIAGEMVVQLVRRVVISIQSV